MKIKITLALISTVLTSAFAQTEKLVSALKLYQGGNIDSAKIQIDAAANDSQTGKDYYTWYMKGFIYKDIYTKREKQNKQSPARIEALRSLKTSVQLDVNKENLKENAGNIKYLANTFRNDVVDHLNSFDSISLSMISANQKIAFANWSYYKDAMTIVDPTIKFDKEEIEITLAMGRLFQNAYHKNPKANPSCLDSAQKYFAKVLLADPSNPGANYGMAIAFYNQGANIVNNANYDLDLIALDKVQDNAKELFLKARPYMEKAHELGYNKDEAITGLCGIYYALNEEEKYLQLKCKY